MGGGSGDDVVEGGHGGWKSLDEFGCLEVRFRCGLFAVKIPGEGKRWGSGMVGREDTGRVKV